MSLSDALADSYEVLKLSDGRQLAYKRIGAPVETCELVAMYHHGTPSCYMEAFAMHDDAIALGLHIVTFDRSGIGASTRRRHSSLTTVVDDVMALMNHLGLERALQIGTSGGGPYAAACAALHPERTLGLTLIAPVANTAGHNWPLLSKMHGTDKLTFLLAKYPFGGLWSLHWALRYMANYHGALLLEHMPEGMGPIDGELIRSDERVAAAFVPCLKHAYMNGCRGMARDTRVLGTRWDVDISGVKCPTLIFVGSEDHSCPPEHARWYEGKIQGSKLTIVPGEAHVSLMLRQGKHILTATKEAQLGAKAPDETQTAAKAPEEAQPVAKTSEEAEPADASSKKIV